MPVRANSLKQKLREGQIVFGTFVRTADPAVIEVLAHSGLDFVVLDSEHSPLTLRDVAQLVRAADGIGLPTIVRVARNDPVLIMQALDMGALGVQVPQVNTASEALAAARAARYPPEGDRGFAATTRAACHGFMPTREYHQLSNTEIMVVIYIETAQAVQNVEKIAEVPGVDVLFVGPFDLSVSYGVPGELDHHRMQAAIDEVAGICRKAGKHAGILAGTPERAYDLIQRGYRYIVYGSDLGLMAQGTSQALHAIRQRLEPSNCGERAANT